MPTADIAAITTPAEDRNATINVIRQSLRIRSGKAWSVKGGTGTAWGWITVTAPPARCDRYGAMTESDAAELGALLGLDGPAHHQGVSIPSSCAYRREFIERAYGVCVTAIATPYWD